jgi:hypothetical protein
MITDDLTKYAIGALVTGLSLLVLLCILWLLKRTPITGNAILDKAKEQLLPYVYRALWKTDRIALRLATESDIELRDADKVKLANLFYDRIPMSLEWLKAFVTRDVFAAWIETTFTTMRRELDGGDKALDAKIRELIPDEYEQTDIEIFH